MGFAVSNDGLVLTTYDVISGLGIIKQGSIKISAAFATDDTQPSATLPAVIYSEDLTHQLLLLHVKGLKRKEGDQ